MNARRLDEPIAAIQPEVPPLLISRLDCERIEALLDSPAAQSVDTSALRAELDRAHVIEPAQVPPDVVTMNSRVRAKSIEEFGELVRHPGEEYIHVMEGRAEVHTEFYDPIVLGPGESVYIDSNMGHAYIAAEGCDEVVLLGVCSSADDQLMESLLHMHGESSKVAAK